jgi:TatD DNase family protein
MKYSDAHIHITHILNWKPLIVDNEVSPVATCVHSFHEWNQLSLILKKQLLESNYCSVVRAFGVHPQNPDIDVLHTLENLLTSDSKNIHAIGEMGFDLYTPLYASKIDIQEIVWEKQLDLAFHYEKPIIIHCRKAIDRIFRDSKKIAKIPAVVFHGFPGSVQEGNSLLARGINAFFSVGKGLHQGNKRLLSCTKELPLNRLLAETDAPYMTLKSETVSVAEDIINVYKKIAELKKVSVEEVTEQILINFKSCYNTASIENWSL